MEAIRSRSSGFTIVELLIVVVIIAILAAITIIAFNGVQNRANDSALSQNATVVSKAVTMYQVDNSKYPICAGGDGTSCTLASVSSNLVPMYTSNLPDDTQYPYMYVGTATGGGMWSVRIYKKSIGNFCKIGSSNMLSTWWSNAPVC